MFRLPSQGGVDTSQGKLTGYATPAIRVVPCNGAPTPLGLRGSERAIIFMNNDWPKVRGISSQKSAANWPDLFGSPHPRCGNLAQPSNSVFVYLLVCSPHSLPALPHPHSTEMKPQPPHAVDYLVVSQSTGAANRRTSITFDPEIEPRIFWYHANRKLGKVPFPPTTFPK